MPFFADEVADLQKDKTSLQSKLDAALNEAQKVIFDFSFTKVSPKHDPDSQSEANVYWEENLQSDFEISAFN